MCLVGIWCSQLDLNGCSLFCLWFCLKMTSSCWTSDWLSKLLFQLVSLCLKICCRTISFFLRNLSLRFFLCPDLALELMPLLPVLELAFLWAIAGDFTHSASFGFDIASLQTNKTSILGNLLTNSLVFRPRLVLALRAAISGVSASSTIFQLLIAESNLWAMLTNSLIRCPAIQNETRSTNAHSTYSSEANARSQRALLALASHSKVSMMQGWAGGNLAS